MSMYERLQEKVESASGCLLVVVGVAVLFIGALGLAWAVRLGWEAGGR